MIREIAISTAAGWLSAWLLKRLIAPGMVAPAPSPASPAPRPPGDLLDPYPDDIPDGEITIIDASREGENCRQDADGVWYCPGDIGYEPASGGL